MALGQAIRRLLEAEGGVDFLYDQVQSLSAHHGNNLLPFFPPFYSSFRSILFDTVETLDTRAAMQASSMHWLTLNRTVQAALNTFLPTYPSILPVVSGKGSLYGE
ncbi:MAG: hypothetical protein JXB30_11480 [Anaerolineae bacterium]|nr:hypothetical protein [Anaerolineae bacterium]